MAKKWQESQTEKKRFLHCEFVSCCFGAVCPNDRITLTLVKGWDLFGDG